MYENTKERVNRQRIEAMNARNLETRQRDILRLHQQLLRVGLGKPEERGLEASFFRQACESYVKNKITWPALCSALVCSYIYDPLSQFSDFK